MSKLFFSPLALVALASVTLTGHAHAQDTLDPNTRSGTTQQEAERKRDESAPSGGSITETVVVLHVARPAADATAITRHNPIKINKMFGEIEDTKTYDVLELARTSPNLSTFVELVERANLVDDLQRLDSVTLFAPTNEAFAKVPQAKLDALLDPDNKALLSRMLQTHVVASDVASDNPTRGRCRSRQSRSHRRAGGPGSTRAASTGRSACPRRHARGSGRARAAGGAGDRAHP